jgi:hypothetical protein
MENAGERMPRLLGLPAEQTKGPVYIGEYGRGEGILGCVSCRIDFTPTVTTHLKFNTLSLYPNRTGMSSYPKECPEDRGSL